MISWGCWYKHERCNAVTFSKIHFEHNSSVLELFLVIFNFIYLLPLFLPTEIRAVPETTGP